MIQAMHKVTRTNKQRPQSGLCTIKTRLLGVSVFLCLLFVNLSRINKKTRRARKQKICIQGYSLTATQSIVFGARFWDFDVFRQVFKE